MAGVTPSAISQAEAGRRGLSLDTLDVPRPDLDVSPADWSDYVTLLGLGEDFQPTEDIFGNMPKPAEGEFDPLDPSNISPIVVALAADEAQSITGQCFFVYGPAINVLKPWDVGTFVRKDDYWEPDELAGKLKEAFPNGIAPEGMMPMLGKASGQA